MARTTVRTCRKYFASLIFLVVVLSSSGLVCFANAQHGKSQQVISPYPIDTPVYKNNDNDIDEWIEGSILSFDPSTNTYEVSWSDMTIEYTDAETTNVLVHNEHYFDEYMLIQSGEEEIFMQEKYEEDALITGEVDSFGSMSRMEEDEGDNIGDGQQTYQVGTNVSVQNEDGTWTGGKIVTYGGGYYTIKWDHNGDYQVFAADDGDVDQMVLDAISQNSTPSDEDIGYFPSSVEEAAEPPMTNKNKNTSNFSMIPFVFAGIVGALVLVTVGYVRHNRLDKFSSTSRNESDGSWGRNGKPETSLSIQMDSSKNLRSIL